MVDGAIDDRLGRTEQSWQQLLEAIAGIPAERMTEPGVIGEWSVKDLLGHVAYWDDHGARIARQLAQGEEPQYADYRQVNEPEVAARSHQTVDQALAELHRAHGRLLATLRELPDFDPSQIAQDTHDHYDEHTAQLRAWRERTGS